MSTLSTHFATVRRVARAAAPVTPSAGIGERISSLYAFAERSSYVFGSPLGPVQHNGRQLSLPRFVYFGPHTHDESLRLAFYAGFDHRDQRGSYALVSLAEQLALKPDLGQGLNLALFPVIDVLGALDGAGDRDLASADWARSTAPEIDLLEKDARTRGYHGFVRIETSASEDILVARLRGAPHRVSDAPGVELISSADFDPLPVKWEADTLSQAAVDGPLSVADDLPFRAFELTLRVPSSWSAELYSTALSSILKRFILRYRAVQAHAYGI